MTDESSFLVLSVIGDDRPGLVGDLAAVIRHHGGNWLEASMSHLAGKFAGIVRVSIATAEAESLRSALGALPGLNVQGELSHAAAAQPARRLTLSLVGHDRIGIVSEVTAALARHAANIEKIETNTASAPMAAGVLFYADVSLTARSDIDIAALQADLERISNDLMVDIALGETIRG